MANCSQINNTTIIGTSAVSYDSTPLPCTDVKACDDLNTILTKFDNVICSAVNSVNILAEEVMNLTEEVMMITEEIENINDQIFICCPICDFTITATELPVCDFTASATQLPDPTTTTTTTLPPTTTTTSSSSTSSSTTTTTTTIPPLNFDVTFECTDDSVDFKILNITGGVPFTLSPSTYLAGNIKFVSEAAALANIVWIGPTTNVTYGAVTLDATWWLVVKDSVGNILAKSVTSNCFGGSTTTTTTTSTAPPVLCNSYTLTTDSGKTATYSYTTCSGSSQSFTVNRNIGGGGDAVITICSSTLPTTTTFGTVALIGTCAGSIEGEEIIINPPSPLSPGTYHIVRYLNNNSILIIESVESFSVTVCSIGIVSNDGNGTTTFTGTPCP